MKKLLITLALCLGLSLLLCACDSTADPQNTETQPPASTDEITETTTEAATDAETEFELIKDEILWGEESGDFLFAAEPGLNYHFSKISYGEIKTYGSLDKLKENAGDQRIAVQILRSWDEEDPPENTDPFVNLPEGYKETYSDPEWMEKSNFEVYFMTADEIDALVCDPKMKVIISSVSYEGFLGLGSN